MPIEVPNRAPIPAGLLPDILAVERILYEAESPVLFLTRTMQDQLLLAYVADDGTNGTFTTLTPVAQRTVVALETGAMPVRDAIESAPTWLHWRKGEESRSWALEAADLPSGHLPSYGTPLLAEHEPVLRTRVTGPAVVLGRMPASVVAFVADSTRKAWKEILDFTLEAKPEGRPTNEHRRLYDLPIKSFAFASFELGFGPPEEGLFTGAQIKGAAELFTRGLGWAGGQDDSLLSADTDAEREAILRAVLHLTPPSSDLIQDVVVSGSWLSGGKVTLTKSSRGRVKSALKRVDSENLFTSEGRLEEIDTGKLTFILRETDDHRDKNCSFDEDLLEDMIAALTKRVKVAGLERQGTFKVTTIVGAPEDARPSTTAQ